MGDDDQKKYKIVELSELKVEDGAKELMSSPDAQVYMNVLSALMQHQDAEPYISELRRVPLQKRYIWRVASALKWAFVDLETEFVRYDRATLSEEDMKAVTELLRLRPAQFCLFLKELVGEDNMNRIMLSAIKDAMA